MQQEENNLELTCTLKGLERKQLYHRNYEILADAAPAFTVRFVSCGISCNVTRLRRYLQRIARQLSANVACRPVTINGPRLQLESIQFCYDPTGIRTRYDHRYFHVNEHVPGPASDVVTVVPCY